MNWQTLYIVVDCFPQPGTDEFRKFAGATVGCWVRSATCDDFALADVLVKEKLSASNWTVASTVVREQVSSADYARDSGVREFFEQALLDGFVANIHVRTRESVGEDGRRDDEILTVLCKVADSVSTNGGFSPFSKSDGQWANGVTAGGDEFLPMWATADDALAWLQHWPEYEVRAMTLEGCPHFLQRVDMAQMWIALGTGESLLTMSHPMWIRELVIRHASAPEPSRPTTR